MNSYIFPIKAAVLTFPFLAMVIAAPFLIYYYRKYGQLGKLRSVILYSFVFYLLCAYYLVILPLPSIGSVAQMTGPRYELHLFQSWHNFMNQTVLQLNNPSTYLAAMKQSVFLEPVFNIFLLFPFGVYCRYYFKFSLGKTILASFCLSLFFELTQLSGLYFIYPRPYRLFDVNDLLHNTIGGLLGFACAPLFTFFLPTRSELDSESLVKGQTVSLLRRFVAMMIDWFVIGILSTLLSFLSSFLPTAVYDLFNYSFVGFTLEVILYFMIFMYLWNGQTVGKKIVRIQVVEKNREHIRLWSLVKRYSAFYLLMYGLLQIFQYTMNHLTTTNHTVFIAYVTFGLISLGILLLFLFNLLYALIRRKHRLFHDKASHTFTISTLKKEV
ncbi:teicoplanin resistance protein VanZ [Enterococcus avium]|uniref:VanZ family protein n=1 Tax=Enterococcus malodoratus TaxID=71451 RepID=UPI0008C7902B|nr:VanZ family protein [Enterococcus malodoratus]BBM18191.1 teicoplanin resistance protein VanZ [Enterococcus avium]SET87282.1 Glycopeptide antibiotics resistance protein [Enterococcus malodoratus]